jgi:hypothetical protein
MFCRYCGAEVPPDRAACPACGKAVLRPIEEEVESAVRTVVTEVKKLGHDVVREAGPAARKAVDVTRGAVRGAVKGVREAVREPSGAPTPASPPPPGATREAPPAKKPPTETSGGGTA